MARSLQDLDVQLSTSQIQTLRPENKAFLQGNRPEPALDGTWEGWITVGKVIVVLGMMAVIAMIGVIGTFILWNSPLAVEVEGTIDDFRGGDVSYHYVVDGKRFDQVEASPRRSSSNWDDGNVPYPIIYLRFLPAVSRLEHNVEPIDWFPMIFMSGIAIAIPAFGLYTIRYTRRILSLRDGATHILQGEIFKSLRGQKGTVNYFYAGTSPTTGQPIRGTLTIGRLNSRFGRIETGAMVAILYKDDKLHTVL